MTDNLVFKLRKHADHPGTDAYIVDLFRFVAGRIESLESEIASLRQQVEGLELAKQGAVAEAVKWQRRAEEAESLLEVPGRKMVYLVRDYKDDKESKAWLEAYAAWRSARGMEGRHEP